MARSLRVRWGVVAAAVALTCAGGGCLGPHALKQTRMRYNEVVRSTNDEQLLTNIVRLRYADSPVFIDLPNITAQFEVTGKANVLGGREPQGVGDVLTGGGELFGRDAPTLSYSPREGQLVARALLTPLTVEGLHALSAGATPDQILMLTINDVNDVPNAPHAAELVPPAPDGNGEFRYGVRLVAAMLDQGDAELSLIEVEKDESDPIAAGSVKGRDVIEAARQGMVFRTRDDGTMAVMTKERVLSLNLHPRAVDSFEAEEMRRIFGLAPGLASYKIRSELARQFETRSGPLGSDTLLLDMRSVLQMMIFLSKGVCVPPEHVTSGEAPTVCGPDGRPYDWTCVTNGLFRVHSGRHRPPPGVANVAIPYRGHWYWIAEDDAQSKAIMTILDLIYSAESVDPDRQGPLLTLPVG